MLRTEHGDEKEVIFRQKKEPGRMGISDFTTIRNSFSVLRLYSRIQ